MEVKSESEVAQSCPTPSDPMDSSLLGSFVHGIFQARVLEWGASASSNLIIYCCAKTTPELNGIKQQSSYYAHRLSGSAIQTG